MVPVWLLSQFLILQTVDSALSRGSGWSARQLYHAGQRWSGNQHPTPE